MPGIGEVHQMSHANGIAPLGPLLMSLTLHITNARRTHWCILTAEGKKSDFLHHLLVKPCFKNKQSVFGDKQVGPTPLV